MILKICGVLDEDQALACVALGATAIGLNLWPGSPRHLPYQAARRISAALRGRGVLRVGLFVNAPKAEVAAALAEDLIDVAQLHGDEEAASPAPGRTWKGVRLAGTKDVDALSAYSAPDWPLLVVDAPSAGYGGSGRRVDTEAAARVARRRPVLLAGGLTPDNVAAAVAAVRPAGVDVASGVEGPARRKDLDKVAAFLSAARAAFLALGSKGSEAP